MNCHRYPDTPCRFRCTDFCRLYGIGYPKDRGGPLFLPSDLPNLAAWYRYNTAVGDAWTDASGNGRDLELFNSPTITDGSVLFNGVDQYGQAAFTLNQPCTFYCLGRQITWTSGDIWWTGAAGVALLVQNGDASPALRVNAGSAVTDQTGLALNTYGAICVVYNGASSVLRINNKETAGNVGAGNPGGINLATGDGSSAFGNVQIKELIVFAAAHDAGQRAKVIEYLARLGNLTI